MWAILLKPVIFGLTPGLFVMGNFGKHSKGFFFSLALLSGLPQSAATLYICLAGFFLGTWSCDDSLATGMVPGIRNRPLVTDKKPRLQSVTTTQRQLVSPNASINVLAISK